MITISLFYYCVKLFILTNVWKIGKNPMKRHYLKKKIFIVTYIWKILLMQLMHMQKEFEKYVQSNTLLATNFRTLEI